MEIQRSHVSKYVQLKPTLTKTALNLTCFVHIFLPQTRRQTRESIRRDCLKQLYLDNQRRQGDKSAVKPSLPLTGSTAKSCHHVQAVFTFPENHREGGTAAHFQR